MAVYLGANAVDIYTSGFSNKPEEEKTAIPTTEDLIITSSEGKTLSKVTIQGDANFLEENIKSGVTIWGKTGTLTNSGQYVWSKKESSDGQIIEYIADIEEAKYPNNGIQDGYYYELIIKPDSILPEKVDGVLIFYSEQPFRMCITNKKKNWNGTLQYSLDNTTWNEWNGEFIDSNNNGIIYMRGIKNTYLNTNAIGASGAFNFEIASECFLHCIGSMDDLLNYSTTPTLAAYCYSHMFYNCTNLVTAPELPATTLNRYCYRAMFYGCKNLKLAPELPATILADYCYSYMFYNCASLTIMPELPATILTKYCYQFMFQNCMHLTTIPELPATTLADYCYKNMFFNCISLTTTPALPATIATNYCYYNMFSNCMSLKTAPELPATTLASYCYSNMFYNCTALTTIPELPATTLATYCYYGMFYSCTSLTSAPSLPATTLADSCYKSMFSGCTSLTTAPELPATTLADSCYQSMFNRCTALTTPPSVLPATTLVPNCYRFMFEFTAIDAIPRIMATAYQTYSCKGMFDDIKTLNVYSTSGTGHTYGWRAPSIASNCCSGMFGSDDGESEWAKLDGSNFPNNGTPTADKTYYFKTVV